MRLAIFLGLSVALYGQYKPQTPAEMLFEEWKAAEIAYYKAPIDASLEVLYPENLASAPLATIDADAPWVTPKNNLEDVTPKNNLEDNATYAPGQFINVYTAPPRVNLIQVVTNNARLTMAFSPGLSVGSGVLSWRATACNVTTTPQAVDQGDIETQAIGTGIPVVGYGEAQDVNRLYINNSTPVRTTQLVEGGAGIGTVLIAARVIAASGVWGAAFGIASYAAGRLVTYLQSVTPANLSARFTGTTILADGSSFTLAPAGTPNHCATWEFFARYGNSNSAIPAKGTPARAARTVIIK